VTAANVHDKHPLPDLLHGNEQRVYGDSAYASQKALIRGKAPQAKDFTNQRTRRAGEVDEVQRAKNRNKSRIRARVEHVFGVVKRLWGFTKVRYRGLQKNATRAFTALALANISLPEATAGTGAPVRVEIGPQGPANGPNGRRKRPQNPKNGVFRVRAGNFEGLFSVALSRP